MYMIIDAMADAGVRMGLPRLVHLIIPFGVSHF